MTKIQSGSSTEKQETETPAPQRDLAAELYGALIDAVANGGLLTSAAKDAILRYEREAGG